MKEFLKRLLAVSGIFLNLLTLTAVPLSVYAEGPFSGSPSGKLAVTPAGYDDMKEVLSNLGFEADEIQESDLSNLGLLQGYDAVYINCSGSTDTYAADAASVVRDYVSGGGVVYASDYANSIIQAAFPGKINFYQGSSIIPGLETDDVSSSRVGVEGKVQASVVDGGLAAVLGKSTVEVNYDLGSWAVMDSVGSGVNVHMRGPVSILDYSSFQDPNLYQNIDFSNPQSLQDLSNEASKNIGDKPFVVSFSEGSGEVLYTTFHNEAQNTADMESILNWFAIRTKGSALVQSTRQLVRNNNQEVLQEIVDAINQGDTKTYYFSASGDADFQVVLNFGGSALSLKITDPNGKQVANQNVSDPPFTQSVNAIKGKYTLEVKGTDVPSKNYPLVLTVAGPKNASGEPITETSKPTSQSPAVPKNLLNLIKYSLLAPILIGAGILLLLIIIIIVVVVVIRRRGKAKPIPPVQNEVKEEPKEQKTEIEEKAKEKSSSEEKPTK